ncbi:uncharacterized protein E0L32_000526 [Thyridium curvatum]|uniref:Thioredoxin domain-containing protein n=1 Tax=Thyridium curvatum TaxID=1093900 RepID=A0A507AVZ5_9PEZI|nr:uncharacterized protein E0L32_000526 [Thyridium curvatum]TPX14132.1 hypothetical protein E0L32_000526 [Thyridium curvatum]
MTVHNVENVSAMSIWHMHLQSRAACVTTAITAVPGSSTRIARDDGRQDRDNQASSCLDFKQSHKLGVHLLTLTPRHSVQQFKDILKANPVVLVDFFATWCAPCKAIAPKLAEWSNQFPNIYYVKVDVDAIPDLAQEYGVRAMPTFMLFKNGEKDADLMGAMPGPLQKLITDNHPAEAATSA